MAFTGGPATYDVTNPGILTQDVANIIRMYSRTETPALDFIGDGDTMASQPLHNWVEESLRAHTTTINDSGGISNSDTSLIVTDGTLFRAHDLIRIGTADEVIRVTAVVTNTLTIVRAHGGTAVSHADGATVYRIVESNEEGGDVSSPAYRNRTLKTNYCGIFEPPPVTVPLAQEVSAKNGGVGIESDHQVAKMIVEAMLDLERAVVQSYAGSSDPGGTDSRARYMNGLRSYASTNVVDASSATLSEDYFRSRLRDFYTNGAKGIDYCLAPAWQKNLIDGFKLSATRWTQSETGAGVETTTYQSGFSTKPIRIILSPWMQADELLFGDSDQHFVVPFIPFQRKRLAESGFYTKEAVHGEYTLEVHDEKSVALVKSLAVS